MNIRGWIAFLILYVLVLPLVSESWTATIWVMAATILAMFAGYVHSD